MYTQFKLEFPSGNALRARVDTRDGEEVVMIGWLKPNGQLSSQEVWLSKSNAAATLKAIQGYVEGLQVVNGNYPKLKIEFPGGYCLRARVDSRDGEEVVMIGWLKPNGQLGSQEVWLSMSNAAATLKAIQGYVENL